VQNEANPAQIHRIRSGSTPRRRTSVSGLTVCKTKPPEGRCVAQKPP
jgi:hypothetical protein